MKKFIAIITVCMLVLAGCSIKPVSWEEHYDAGIKYLEAGNYEGAADAFTLAISADGANADAYIARAKAYLDMGETKENISLALADFATALTLAGPGSELYVYGGEKTVLEMMGELQAKLEAQGGEGETEKTGATVIIDGKEQLIESGCEAVEGDILVPAEFFETALEATVATDAASGAAVITKGEKSLTVNAGASVVVLGESNIPVKTPAKVIDGSVSVPLRFVLELFGTGEMSVGENGAVSVSSEPYITEAEHYRKKVVDSFGDGWDFGYHEVWVPKFNIDTENGRAFDKKISDYSRRVLELLKNNKEETYIFAGVTYDYSVLNGIITVKISSSEGIQYSEGWNTTNCYYYDIAGDREITDFNEYLEIMNIDYEKAVAEANKRIEDTDEYGNRIVLTTDPEGDCPVNYIVFGNDFTEVGYYNPYGMGIDVTFTFEGILAEVQK